MRERAWDAAILIALKLALGALVLAMGFTHVSDDDYARTVIAEQLAHAPRLDPSGTSWLPFPFWIAGLAMAACGRTLGVARGVAVALGAASVAAPYLAMRAARMERWPALAAAALAMALPWNAWLGVATVPEAWAGALLGAALLTMNDPAMRAGAAPWAALALLGASLSRYEAWPACAVFALFVITRSASATRGERARLWAWAVLAIAGPLVWMAWNAHAHGSAFHFVARVTNFRRAAGAADIPLREKLLAYPWGLAHETPEVAVLGVVGIAGLFARRALRARWLWTAIAAAAILAFLIEGDVRDGAPTHHPERALAALWWILPTLGIDALALAAVRIGRSRIAAIAAAMSIGAWCVFLPGRLRAYPGTSDWDRRDPQIARGEAMRARHVVAAEITPCSYEHFALLAAWGEPERAQLNPLQHAPPTADCPLVVER
ncbi:MAG TPA: hypothetical protein VK841_13310 [Polyangiaceae bacterium]|jgi:hypothetical protein|nr:hypothetical protein [Polyangiaceae bacterium]